MEFCPRDFKASTLVGILFIRLFVFHNINIYSPKQKKSAYKHSCPI